LNSRLGRDLIPELCACRSLQLVIGSGVEIVAKIEEDYVHFWVHFIRERENV
jgi:hypothetical protein